MATNTESIFHTVRTRAIQREEADQLEARIADFRTNQMHILETVTLYDHDLRGMERTYIAEGKRRKHRLEKHWKQDKIAQFRTLLHELGLPTHCKSKEYDAVYGSRIKVKNNELIAIPTTGTNGYDLERDRGDSVLPGCLFGGFAGMATGLVLTMPYILISPSTTGLSRIIIGSTILGSAIVIRALNKETTQKYQTINPFSVIAEQMTQRADYIRREIG